MLELSNEPEDAAKYYIKAHSIDPSDLRALKSAAGLCERSGDLESAYTYLLECFETSPYPSDRIVFGQDLCKLLYDAGFFAETLVCCKLVTDLDKNNKLVQSLKAEIIKEHLECVSASAIGELDNTISARDVVDFKRFNAKTHINDIQRLVTPTGGLRLGRETYPLVINHGASLFDFSIALFKTFAILYG